MVWLWLARSSPFCRPSRASAFFTIGDDAGSPGLDRQREYCDTRLGRPSTGGPKSHPCQVVRWQCERYVLSVRPFLAHRRRRRLPSIMISVDGSLAVLLTRRDCDSELDSVCTSARVLSATSSTSNPLFSNCVTFKLFYAAAGNVAFSPYGRISFKLPVVCTSKQDDDLSRRGISSSPFQVSMAPVLS